MLTAAARAALPSGNTNQHRRGSSILQDPTSNTTRRAGSWMLTASARAALPLGDTHQAGGCCRFHLPGLGGAAALFLDAGANTTRPRRGPLFYQATTTSTAAALLSSRIQPGQQGCSRSHSSRASSWPHEAAPPRLFHPPGSNQGNTTRRAGSWMLTASARAALPLGDTHQAGGCCRFHLPGLGGAAALFLDAGANTTRPRRGPLFYQATTTSTAAALLSSRIQPGQHQPGGRRFLGILAASTAGRVPGCWHQRNQQDNSWAGSLDNSNQGAGCSLVAGNSITNFVISVGLI